MLTGENDSLSSVELRLFRTKFWTKQFLFEFCAFNCHRFALNIFTWKRFTFRGKKVRIRQSLFSIQIHFALFCLNSDAGSSTGVAGSLKGGLVVLVIFGNPSRHRVWHKNLDFVWNFSYYIFTSWEVRIVYYVVSYLGDNDNGYCVWKRKLTGGTFLYLVGEFSLKIK